MKNITRVLRALEYSADSIEAINKVLEHGYSYDDKTEHIMNNPINGIMGGGAVTAICDPSSISFSDGKYRLIRLLEYRASDRGLKSGFEVILDTLKISRVPYKGQRVIDGVLIKSGIIGNGFGETIEDGDINETNS